MNILDSLVAGPAMFRGHGMNEENQAFVGELRVQPLEGGRAALLGYVATLGSGQIVHTESTLLGRDDEGRLCLWPVMSELPGVFAHRELVAGSGLNEGAMAVFSTGPRDDSTRFREEITVQFRADGSLVYAHAWALPGGTFQDRSSCRMLPIRA